MTAGYAACKPHSTPAEALNQRLADSMGQLREELGRSEERTTQKLAAEREAPRAHHPSNG